MSRAWCRRAWSIAVAGLALTACGAAGPSSRTLVGPVTVVDATGVCVGGPEASGVCLVEDRSTQGLAVGDCVRVTYGEGDAEGPSTASRVEHLDRSEHLADCPRQ